MTFNVVRRNFFVSGPKYTNVGGAVVDNLLLHPIFDISVRSGDIRNQSQKLSKIAPNFGRCLPYQILGVRPSKSFTRIVMPASRHVMWKSIVRLLPLAKVIGSHTLNFDPFLNFSCKKIVGDPRLWWVGTVG